ncbi:ligase-associated DNA damage response endonuclease PdeM [Acetobacter sicerae]|uniref:Ligase-associated DNA damage response endonuclease PdeM n=1 Tax=Acetobacter sicerae TaxID=85325 RepID=A0ABS8VYS6_9PROT|nr:ligase-associated DNA damage response endonuclease PdeM [Acetobacter sicerae]
MSKTEITLGENRLFLLPSGAVFIPDGNILVVSDLHFEKGSSARTHGLLLPPGDTSSTLEKLEKLVEDCTPQKMIALGDSFHDRNAFSRLSSEDRKRLERITEQTDMVWITGNHDSEPFHDLSGEWVEEFRYGNLLFRHIPSNDIPSGYAEISGHFHPKIQMRIRGHRLSRKCFLASKDRLILPACGSYTGGLDINHPQINSLFPEGRMCFALGNDKVYRME